MKRGIRQKEGEDFSHTKIEEIILLLAAESPITKKDACAKLGMLYNPARLKKIIDEHNETKAYHEKRRKELRNQPLTKEDISYIISSYLEDANLSIIADTTHRNLSVIKKVLEQHNIPLRSSATSYQNPITLQTDAISEEYTKDDLVYSARYDEPAYISSKINTEVYKIWLIKTEQYAFQPYWELGDIRELQQKYGIEITTQKYWNSDNTPGELQQAIAIARQNAKKGNKK